MGLFTEARDSEWQWHQLGQMQVCTSLQTDNHASTPPLSFLQAGCPSCHPTNSIKALTGLYYCTIALFRNSAPGRQECSTNQLSVKQKSAEAIPENQESTADTN